MTVRDPLAVLKALIERCGSQKAAAAKLGCSPQFVGSIVNGRKQIPDAMLGKLGLRRTIIADKAARS